MKGLDRLTYLRLAEILTQNGLATRDEVNEALMAQQRTGEPFVDVVISTGIQSEWELARLVVEAFQLPFLQTDRFEPSRGAQSVVDEEVLCRHSLLPLDLFGKVLTVVMPILTPGEILESIQADKGLEIYPVVGLVSDNRKKLQELFPERMHVGRRREASAQGEPPIPVGAPQGPGPVAGKGVGWESIFDIGDQAVKKGLKGPKA